MSLFPLLTQGDLTHHHQTIGDHQEEEEDPLEDLLHHYLDYHPWWHNPNKKSSPWGNSHQSLKEIGPNWKYSWTS